MLLNYNFNEDNNFYYDCGIDENTFYKWLKNDEFEKYMEEAVAIHITGENPKVIKSLIEQCVKGNSTALKIYFDLKNKEKKSSSKNYVTISDDIPAKKWNIWLNI